MIKEATPSDVASMQVVRLAVRENILSDPSKVTNEDVLDYITRRGKGWIYKTDSKVVGFAIADLVDHNIWALFLLPAFEGKGIGRQLHETMLQWYFEHTDHPVWLSTERATRAEAFYTKAGWKNIGAYSTNEIKFEMTKEVWQQSNQ
jgi:GNAT superfamily N-acetyltransferase